MPKDRKRKLSDSDKELIKNVEAFLMNTGSDRRLGKDDFLAFVKKFVRDTLYYDQGCFEITRKVNGKPHEFFAVPGETIRLAIPPKDRGTPPENQQQENETAYVQVVDGRTVAEYTHRELCFAVMNPRTDIRVYRYGYAPCEQLILTVTSHLWAEEFNRRQFTQGSFIKGVLNLKGNISEEQLQNFRRQWLMQVSGVTNAWRMPVVASEGMDWVPLQFSNNEMGYSEWMNYLINISCAIFLFDPAEINFDTRGGISNAPMFMGTNEAQQKMSKDRGLPPLLRHVATAVSRYLVEPFADWLEFEFAGLDAKTEEQAIQLRTTEVTTYKTLNEGRAAEDLPPLPNGDVPLNPTYTGYLMQREQMQMQQQVQAQQQGGAAANPAGPPNEGGAGGDDHFGGPAQPGQQANPEVAKRLTRKLGKEDEDQNAQERGSFDFDMPGGPGESDSWEASVHSGPTKSLAAELKKAFGDFVEI
jgi:hypothetical protein